METKYVIFVFISTFLIAAIYSSSSSNYASAAVKTTCTEGKTEDGGKFNIRTCCTIKTDEQGNVENTLCWVQVCPTGGGNCKIMTKEGAPKIPEDLGGLVENNTKSPNTDILKDNTTLQQNNDDGEEPKAPKVPEDLGGLNDNNAG